MEELGWGGAGERTHGCAGTNANEGRRTTQGACAVTGLGDAADREAPARSRISSGSDYLFSGCSVLFPPSAYFSDPRLFERFPSSFAPFSGHIRREASRKSTSHL